MENEKVEIYSNKTAWIFYFLGAIIFVIAGIFIIIYGKEYQPVFSNPFLRFMHNKVTQIFIGIMGILFFGFAAIVFFIKIFDKKPGLIIDSTGIIDNPNRISARHIRWENITGIKSFKGKSVVIVIDNPNEYIERYKNIISKISAKIDSKIMGSPINIPTDVLKCKHKELVNILQTELERRKGT